MGVGGTGGVGGAGPSSAVGGLVGMGVDPGLAAAAVAAANSGPSGPVGGTTGGGFGPGANPGNTGMGAGYGASVPGNVGSPAAAPSGIGNGHGGVSGSPGGTSGGAQAAAGPGGVGSGHHGFGPSGGMGSAFGGGKGDFGGPSIGSPEGPSSFGGDRGILGNIGLAALPGLADAVHGWGRGQSTQAMDTPSPVGSKADFGDLSGIKGDLGKLSGRAVNHSNMRSARGDDGSTHSKGAQSRGLAPGDMISSDRVAQVAPRGMYGLDVGAQQRGWANSRVGFPTRGALANPDPGPRGQSAPARDGHATAQDPGPRGQPAPPGPRHSSDIPAPVGPRHSSGIPSPVSQDQDFNMRTDFGPIADRVFGGLRQARDAFSGMEARHGFQQSRPGGVGGGRPRAGNRAQSLGQLLFDRGK